MHLLLVWAMVILVMLVIAYAEIKREPRWTEKEEAKPQHKKAA